MSIRNFFVAAAVLLTACTRQKPAALPIYGERSAVKTTVNGEERTDTIYQTIPQFKFVDQTGDTVTNKTLAGKVYVADFFFTSCPSICPIMSRNMKKIYDHFKVNNDVRFLSHTIDPRHDSVPELKKYAGKLGVTDKRWLFVLGPKEVVYPLAEKSYLVSVNEDGKAPGGFIHQGYFVLIDKERRVRGAYDGTNDKQIATLTKDISRLLEEYKK